MTTKKTETNETPEVNPMPPVHTKFHLMVRLTEREMAEKGEEIALRLEEFKNADEERKAQAAICKARTATVAELRDILLNGQEMRDVPVTVSFNPDENEAIITRDDTGEEVNRRPMTAEEKQPKLFPDEDEEEVAEEQQETPFDEDGDEPIATDDQKTDRWLDDVTEEAEDKANLQAVDDDAPPEDGGWTADTNDQNSEFFHLFNAGAKKSACGSFKADKGAALLPIEFTADMACPECLETMKE